MKTPNLSDKVKKLIQKKSNFFHNWKLLLGSVTGLVIASAGISASAVLGSEKTKSNDYKNKIDPDYNADSTTSGSNGILSQLSSAMNIMVLENQFLKKYTITEFSNLNQNEQYNILNDSIQAQLVNFKPTGISNFNPSNINLAKFNINQTNQYVSFGLLYDSAPAQTPIPAFKMYGFVDGPVVNNANLILQENFKNESLQNVMNLTFSNMSSFIIQTNIAEMQNQMWFLNQNPTITNNVLNIQLINQNHTMIYNINVTNQISDITPIKYVFDTGTSFNTNNLSTVLQIFHSSSLTSFISMLSNNNDDQNKIPYNLKLWTTSLTANALNIYLINNEQTKVYQIQIIQTPQQVSYTLGTAELFRTNSINEISNVLKTIPKVFLEKVHALLPMIPTNAEILSSKLNNVSNELTIQISDSISNIVYNLVILSSNPSMVYQNINLTTVQYNNGFNLSAISDLIQNQPSEFIKSLAKYNVPANVIIQNYQLNPTALVATLYDQTTFSQYNVVINLAVPNLNNLGNELNNQWLLDSDFNPTYANPNVISTGVSPYYAESAVGLKTYFPIDPIIALKNSQAIKDYFTHFLSQKNITTLLGNDFKAYFTNLISETYQKWGQTSYLGLNDGAFFNMKLSGIDVSASKPMGTFLTDSNLSFQVNNFTDSDQTLDLTSLGLKNYTLPANTSMSVSMNLANATISPTLFAINDSKNVMSLSYAINNIAVSWKVSNSKVENNVKISNLTLNKNPYSLNTLVSGVSASSSYLELNPQIQKDYLQQLTSADIEASISKHAQQYYNKMITIASQGIQVILNTFDTANLKDFLIASGAPVAKFLSVSGVAAPIVNLISQFFSNISVKQFVNSNYDSIKDLLRMLNVDPSISNIVLQSLNSILNSNTDALPKQDSEALVSDSVVQNVLTLVNNLQSFANGNILDFLGYNLNLILSIAKTVTATDGGSVNKIIGFIQTIVQIMKQELVSEKVISNTNVSLMKANLFKILYNPQFLNKLIGLAQSSLGKLLPSSIASVKTMIDKILTLPNINLNYTTVFNLIKNFFSQKVDGQTLTQYFENDFEYKILPGNSVNYNSADNLLNVNYSIQIVSKKNVTWNLTALHAIFENVSLYDLLLPFNVWEGISWWYRWIVVAYAKGLKIASFIPNTIQVYQGQGLEAQFFVHNAPLGTSYDSSTNQFSWTAPMQTVVTPMFNQTIGDIVNHIESNITNAIAKDIAKPYIKKYVSDPLYFYGQYGYSSYDVFSSSYVNSSKTLTLDNFNVQKMNADNTIRVLPDNTDAWKANAADLIGKFNSNVTNSTNNNISPGNNQYVQNQVLNAADIKQGTSTYEKVNAIKGLILQKNAFVNLGSYFAGKNAPYISVNMYRVFQVASPTLTDWNLVKYTVYLFFTTPVAELSANGSVYWTNWISFNV